MTQSPHRPLCGCELGVLESCTVCKDVWTLSVPLPTSMWSRLSGLVPRGVATERGRKEGMNQVGEAAKTLENTWVMGGDTQGDGDEEKVEVDVCLERGGRKEITERANKRSKRTDRITSLRGCTVGGREQRKQGKEGETEKRIDAQSLDCTHP